jgi:hypothetical protein
MGGCGICKLSTSAYIFYNLPLKISEIYDWHEHFFKFSKIIAAGQEFQTCLMGGCKICKLGSPIQIYNNRPLKIP